MERSEEVRLVLIMIIIASVIIALLLCKGSLIWRSVMLEQNEQRRKDFERVKESKQPTLKEYCNLNNTHTRNLE